MIDPRTGDIRIAFVFHECNDRAYTVHLDRLLPVVPRVGDKFTWNVAGKPHAITNRTAVIEEVEWYDGPQPIPGTKEWTMDHGHDVVVRGRIECERCRK